MRPPCLAKIAKDVDTGTKRIETVEARSMHEQDSPAPLDAAATEAATEAAGEAKRGEFDHLLRQIEKEPVPERLLELALKLQAALIERREAACGQRGQEEA